MIRRCVLVVLWLLVCEAGVCQIRLNVLRLQRKEVYEIKGSDIIVVDSLYLGDSSKIVLNKTVKENFIHATKMVVGKGVVIDGRGINGIAGKPGQRGNSAGGPCRDGSDGQQGTAGADGTNALNVFLYVSELTINGTLILDITGGDGGEGGKGGAGGDGSAGTRLCAGGSGGEGGAGSAGGAGGAGGSLTITSPYGSELRPRIGDKIIVRSFGGFGGQAGDGGTGGQRGLGSLKDGVTGKKGAHGTHGLKGKPGAVFFERK